MPTAPLLRHALALLCCTLAAPFSTANAADAADEVSAVLDAFHAAAARADETACAARRAPANGGS